MKARRRYTVSLPVRYHVKSPFPQAFSNQGNFNYRSSCTRGIFAPTLRDAMVVQSERTTMDHDCRPSMDEIHLRILRVTEDLRAIQQELNCAAMQAPNDPELMEALSDPPELDSLQVLKSALDQMRHFLWFYMQVMTNDSELGDQLRQSLRQNAGPPARDPIQHQIQSVADAMMLRFLADNKHRKPN
jgi:hypothetical protein